MSIFLPDEQRLKCLKPFKGEAIINCKSASEEVKQANQKLNSRKIEEYSLYKYDYTLGI